MTHATPITQQELELLLKEAEQIASGWGSYLQFKEHRSSSFSNFLSLEGLN
jgi:hypothetical protein